VNFLTKINGRIVNYRTGPKAQMTSECLIQFEKFESVSLASKLIGQKVLWKQGKSELRGKIVGLHGRKGMVRVKFARGVPGQAIGTTVELTNQD
jgi:large subunit ribosomal protein L35Ae